MKIFCFQDAETLSFKHFLKKVVSQIGRRLITYQMKVILMDTIDCIMSRTSVRQYTGEKISKKDLLTILKAGMAAPSARNVQPWSFVIIQDDKILKELNEKLPYCKMISDAGTGIVVCGVTDKLEGYGDKYWVQDCSAVTENILLAANALGYGTVWTAVYPDEKRMEIVKDALNLPKNIIPLKVSSLVCQKKKNNTKKTSLMKTIYIITSGSTGHYA